MLGRQIFWGTFLLHIYHYHSNKTDCRLWLSTRLHAHMPILACRATGRYAQNLSYQVCIATLLVLINRVYGANNQLFELSYLSPHPEIVLVWPGNPRIICWHNVYGATGFIANNIAIATGEWVYFADLKMLSH